jgi:hypothetical protein
MFQILGHYFRLFFVTGYYLLVAFPLVVSAATLSLEWEENDPAATGYRLFRRTSGQSYNYSNWIYSGSVPSFVVENLENNVTYYFVVRAFNENAQSIDSNEVEYTPEDGDPNPIQDSDGDGVIDDIDAFPNDPDEWIDTDNDGIGNNADTDDDDDGMPDNWEIDYGLNPLVDDAHDDLDGDGVDNIDEYENGGNPSLVPGNEAPNTPELLEPAEATIVGLMPSLTVQDYYDSDGDAHARTRYQIALDANFSMLVLDRTTSNHLTGMTVMDLILDLETTYYWRVQFIDNRNGKSDWSAHRSFSTLDASDAGDADENGVLDDQEVDMNVDLDNDGTPDAIQDGLLCVSTSDEMNPYVAVKQVSSDAQVVSVRALTLNGLGLSSTQPEQMTGLISFKIYLAPDVTTASITVLFSEPAPDNAQWYKFSTDDGWQVYPNVAFSEDRKSMTVFLEDGGVGDQDGVQNGVIVDPSGLGYQQSSNNGSSSTITNQSSCFISTPLSNIEAQKSHSLVLMLLVVIGGAVCGVVERRSKYK